MAAILMTWIYTPWSNSGFELTTSLQLPQTHARGHQVLPTVCDTYVMLVISVGDIWLFDGRNEMWSRVPLHASNSDFFPVEGAVAIRHPTCTFINCICSETVLIYGRLADHPGTLQLCELNCQRTQDEQLHCNWVNPPYECKTFSVLTTNRSTDGEGTIAHGLMAAADHGRGIVYFLRRCVNAYLDYYLAKQTTL